MHRKREGFRCSWPSIACLPFGMRSPALSHSSASCSHCILLKFMLRLDVVLIMFSDPYWMPSDFSHRNSLQDRQAHANLCLVSKALYQLTREPSYSVLECANLRKQSLLNTLAIGPRSAMLFGCVQRNILGELPARGEGRRSESGGCGSARTVSSATLDTRGMTIAQANLKSRWHRTVTRILQSSAKKSTCDSTYLYRSTSQAHRYRSLSYPIRPKETGL